MTTDEITRNTVRMITSSRFSHSGHLPLAGFSVSRRLIVILPLPTGSGDDFGRRVVTHVSAAGISFQGRFTVLSVSYYFTAANELRCDGFTLLSQRFLQASAGISTLPAERFFEVLTFYIVDDKIDYYRQ